MRLLDTYATNTGSTIDVPYIYTKYFPLPAERYITLQAQTPYDSRNYEYWQEVIDIINPILVKNNIKIVHTGLKDEKKYNGVIDILGQTNINQFAYVIQNTLLHFGSDSFGVHLASYYDKPIVALYSISNPNVAGPHFGNFKNHILIKGYENLGTKKPSYSQVENPKSINTIKPEEIVKSILNLLNIKNENIYETVFIGNRYGQTLLECIPSVILPPNIFQNGFLNIRFDYIDTITDNDYVCTLNNLHIRDCTIITDKPLELEKLSQLKNKITSIFYDITFNDINFDFINKVKFLGVKIDFIFNKSKNNNENILNDKKLQLIDYPELINILEFQSKPKDLIFTSKAYKSKKILFANNKTYLSKAAFIEDKPTSTLEFQNINEINNIELLIEEDSDFCLFYK